MKHVAEFAAGDHVTGFLHQRIIAIVKIDRVNHFRLRGELDQFPGFDGGHGQWLFGNNVFARGDDLFTDGEMEVIGRAIMDDLDVLIGQERIHTAVRFRDVKLVGLGLGELIVRLAQRGHFDKAQSAGRFDVRGPDETGADNSCFDGSHLGGW